jgi:hypothetical protein
MISPLHPQRCFLCCYHQTGGLFSSKGQCRQSLTMFTQAAQSSFSLIGILSNQITSEKDLMWLVKLVERRSELDCLSAIVSHCFTVLMNYNVALWPTFWDSLSYMFSLLSVSSDLNESKLESVIAGSRYPIMHGKRCDDVKCDKVEPAWCCWFLVGYTARE